MMFGNFSEISVTKELADSHYKCIVFTTSLESKIGRTVTSILASGWGTNKYAHGLSTGSLFKYDLGTNQEVDSGFIHIPKKPGIGIDLNFNHLKEIT
jgi:L-alanine-DL-glutamate epimerase-like enolase superfamily enzyme